MGLGAGSPGVLAPQGYAFTKPLSHLREYCEVIPRLVRGERVSYDGEFVQLDGAQIEDLMSSQGQPAARARTSRSTSGRPGRGRLNTRARSRTAC